MHVTAHRNQRERPVEQRDEQRRAEQMHDDAVFEPCIRRPQDGDRGDERRHTC
jgi:hypothetical protein